MRGLVFKNGSWSLFKKKGKRKKEGRTASGFSQQLSLFQGRENIHVIVTGEMFSLIMAVCIQRMQRGTSANLHWSALLNCFLFFYFFARKSLHTGIQLAITGEQTRSLTNGYGGRKSNLSKYVCGASSNRRPVGERSSNNPRSSL